MRRLAKPKPIHGGFLQALALTPLVAVPLALFFEGIESYPSPNLMRSIAEIGVAILLGYVIEAVWMTTRLERKGDDREDWLGSMAGLALGGLLGIVAALLVAAHREAGQANFLDTLGLCWATVSLGLLGVLITLQPVIVDRWSGGQANRR